MPAAEGVCREVEVECAVMNRYNRTAHTIPLSVHHPTGHKQGKEGRLFLSTMKYMNNSMRCTFMIVPL